MAISCSDYNIGSSQEFVQANYDENIISVYFTA